jgi:hypothetical protein
MCVEGGFTGQSWCLLVRHCSRFSRFNVLFLPIVMCLAPVSESSRGDRLRRCSTALRRAEALRPRPTGKCMIQLHDKYPLLMRSNRNI